MAPVGPVFTKEVEGVGGHRFTAVVYDCEPAGLLIIATVPGGDRFTLAPSKKELIAASVQKNARGYEKLVSSLVLLEAEGGEEGSRKVQLVSMLNGIEKTPPPPSAATAEQFIIKAPAGKNTLPEFLAKGLTELCREKPVGLDAVEWLGKWLLENNPNQPTRIINAAK